MAVILPILSTFNSAGIKSAQKQLGLLGGALKTLGKQATVAYGGFKLLQGAIDFSAEAITQARDLERNMSALSTVFGNLTPRMEAFAKNAHAMGISQSDAAKTATFLGSVLKQAGLPMDQVATKTEELTTLAQDLATTYGYETSEALTAMTALFRGEYDPIEKFGVALKQNEVNALVAAKGLSHLTGQELLNAQQTVRMEQLFLRSADAAGAFARQSGTLFVEQKKLTAVFDNMQAIVGAELTPAIADLMQAMVPVVNEQSPKMVSAFEQIAKVIEDLTPIVKPLGDIFGNLIGAFGSLVAAMEPFIKLAASTLAVALELLADLLHDLGVGIAEITGWFGSLWSEADKDWGDTNILTWVKDFLDQGTILKGIFGPIISGLERIWELSQFGAKGDTTDETSRLIRQRLERLGAVPGPTSTGTGTGTGTGKKTATNFVKEFYDGIAEETSKVRASKMLENLGLSPALIKDILASSEWRKVFIDVKNSGASALKSLQAQFNKTAEGIKELADIQKEIDDYNANVQELKDKFREKELQGTNELTEAANRASDALREDFEAFKAIAEQALTAGREAINVFRTLGQTIEMGQFESEVVGAFNNVAASLKSAFENKAITEASYKNLLAYAKRESQLISDIGRQRDELAAKKSKVEAILDGVKSSFFSFADINSIVKSTSQSVTETTTKIIDGLTVSVKRTFETTKAGVAAADNFKVMVDKAKNFVAQLKQLKAQGLDKDLFKQIVDSGIEAGSATAEGILAGGPKNIQEINALFTDLKDVAEQAADLTAVVMENKGVEVAGGFLNGIISQDKLLFDAAAELGNTFATAFDAALTGAVEAAVMTAQNALTVALQAISDQLKSDIALLISTIQAEYAKALAKLGPAPAGAIGTDVTTGLNDMSTGTVLRLGDIKLGDFGDSNAALAQKLIASPKATAWNTAITINAGAGTNGKELGKLITVELNKFAKANGIKVS